MWHARALRVPFAVYRPLAFLLVWTVVLSLAGEQKAYAGGPRFVSGSGLAASSGLAEGWAISQLTYFTDPGDLNAGVTHAQADAMVAAAAAVWNVPTSSLTLSHGGELAEHVSGANSYFDGANFVFPADVQASNETAVPLPVVYDTDGSVTDLLLGSGASDPLECRQNAVTESVDGLEPDALIHHAIVVLNGRCVGSAPEQLTQMQYQLARVFGRVLGVAWSQTNDNVFTAVTPVTADQETYWPLMHPLDVLCATYSYQCMLNPFSLRPDDLSALALLYPIPAGVVPPGKQASGAGAGFLYTSYRFPDGQGMAWVNFTARRQLNGVMDDFEIVSGVSGGFFQQSLPSPVTGVQAVNEGSPAGNDESYAFMRVVPLGGVPNVFITSEPINPLYSAEYALGPFARPPVTPSGSSQTWVDWFALSAPDSPVGVSLYAGDAASSCSPGNDGSESAPAAFNPGGWQTGLLCGWGHNSWWSATLRAGRTWTLEVTATDETGAATTNKSQPVVGIWNAGDSTGTPPTLASAAVPFNSMAVGVTQLQMPASTVDTPIRFVVGDQYGAGRPDFTYTARLLYADSVSPATVGAGGGTVTITGTGFRQGNLVQVNGVTAVVTSWTATQIIALAPPFALSGAIVGTPVAVSVTDTTTNGSTLIPNALTYSSAPDLLQLVSAPQGLETGVASAAPFAVRVVASDGITPVAGATVSFSTIAGSASYGLCGTLSSCTGVSDANGQVQTAVTGGALGSVTLAATEVSDPGPGQSGPGQAGQNQAMVTDGATVQVTLNDTAPARSVALSSSAQYVAAGAGGSWTLQVTAVQDGLPAVGAPVSWNVSEGLVLASSTGSSSQNGSAAANVDTGTVAAGSVSTLSACAWTTVCATWTVYGVDASQWQVGVSSGGGQSVVETAALGTIGLLVTDGSGHTLSGAPVEIRQRVLGWEGPCPASGACPAAPVLASSQVSAVSDNTGNVAVAPLQLPGIPQMVEIAVSTGTQGFVTTTLVKAPQLNANGNY